MIRNLSLLNRQSNDNKRIALFFDRTYIDAQFCFIELINCFLEEGYAIDIYYKQSNYSTPPSFFSEKIRLFSIPQSLLQKIGFWLKIIFSKDRTYKLTIGTPIDGVWLSYLLKRIKHTPYLYFADEIFDAETKHHKLSNWGKSKVKDINANLNALGTIALGKERFEYQQKINGLPTNHIKFILPNAPRGESKRLRSNYLRDILDINDTKPIVLFLGTHNWKLAEKLWEQSKSFSEEDFHLIYHSRSIEKERTHPFIKISNQPLPSYMLNYLVSSADLGLALYDENNDAEKENALTGGKIGVYLKNNLPIIYGNSTNLKTLDKFNIGVYWDGETDIRETIKYCLNNAELYKKSIVEYYTIEMNYNQKFKDLLEIL